MFNSPAPRATPRRSRARDSLSISRGTPSLHSESDAGTATSFHSRSGTGLPSSSSMHNLNLTRTPGSRASGLSGLLTGAGARAGGGAEGNVTPSVRSSRVKALRRGAGSPASSVGGDSTRTLRTLTRGQEGDGGSGLGAGTEGSTWMKDERLWVYAAGSLPREVQTLLKRADLVSRPVTGHVDPLSGYAMVCTPEGCLAWNYQRRTHSSPTCYSLPAPPQSTRGVPTPVSVGIYVPSLSGSTEPGLVMVTQEGELRFWENMSLVLANPDRCQEYQIDLARGDRADRIWRIEGNVFVVTTFSSAAFRIAITSHAGRTSVSINPLTRPGGMFARASTQIFPKTSNRSDDEERTGIRAVTCIEGSTYLLAGETVQKWSIGVEGHRFVQEYNLLEVVGRSLFEDDYSSGTYSIDLQDVQANGNNQLAVLVSYVEQQSTSSAYQRSRTMSLVMFNIDSRSNSLTPVSVVPISHVAYSDPRVYDIPKLHIPYGSHLAFVRLADVLITVTLNPGEEYEDIVALKDGDRSVFIGAGCKDFPISSSRRQHGPPLVLMPQWGGLVGIEINDETIERESGMDAETAMLKSKLEQAVFYGDRSDNPLAFDLPPGIEGDVAVAAEAVSAEILGSASQHAPSFFDLKTQLLDRLSRHSELITFIRGNGLLSLVPQTTRRNLCRDAEKAKAAIGLWEYQDRLMDRQSLDGQSQSLLAEAIVSLLRDREVEGDDVVRMFFRSELGRLDKSLETVLQLVRTNLPAITDKEQKTALLLEANKIVTLVIRSAAAFREDEGTAYEVNGLNPTTELWTASDVLIDGLDFLYTATQQLIKDRTRTLGSVIDEAAMSSAGDSRDPQLRQQRQRQATLKTQMSSLAAALCNNMEDKVRFSLTRQATNGGDPQDCLALQRRYDQLKPRVIRPLVTIDKVAEAYELAEHHTDFPTLVWLCHEPASARGQARIQAYIEKLGEEFAFVLYQWYIDQGRLYDLMSQDQVYSGLLTKFFEMTDHPELAWMHHIACGRYAEAAGDLVAVNKDEQSLMQKHLIGSVGKLAAVVGIKRSGVSVDATRTLSGIDEDLELVQLENELRAAFMTEMPAHRSTGKVDHAAIQNFVEARSTSLEARPGLKALFGRSVQRLVDGQALNVEGLVDVLTLNDDAARKGDPALALDRLSRDESLPEGRRQVALLSIWRRVFIRDDWPTIAQTSGRSDEAQRRVQRGTLTYHTIRAINEISTFPPAYVLSPYTSSQPPLREELSARFPDWPPADIDALMADHEDEIEVLNRYMEDHDLEGMVKEVADLVERDRLEEEEGEAAEAEDDLLGDAEGDVTM